MEKHGSLLPMYKEIYQKGSKDYWIALSHEINTYCSDHKLTYVNYFYHEELVKEKLEREKHRQ